MIEKDDVVVIGYFKVCLLRQLLGALGGKHCFTYCSSYEIYVMFKYEIKCCAFSSTVLTLYRIMVLE